jgi:hypothetical protein
MIPSLRKSFNDSFTDKQYQAFLSELNSYHPGALEFRVAETPIFVPRDFTQAMLDACDSMADVILQKDFRQRTDKAIPVNLQVPGDNDFSQFIAFDFGVCENEKGELQPMLIELQGFPTLFAYEILLDDIFRKYFPVPEGFSCYLNHFNRESYLDLLKKCIIGGEDPSSVILLEIFPHKQKTRIDFYCTKDYLGIEPVCLTELIKEGKKLFYIKDGKKTPVKRIYNRVIFDDLMHQPTEVQEKGKFLFEELDVQWVPHPAWFYRISKFTMPLIKHACVPETVYLSDLKVIPADLENYVLKPLFSFAGQGVVIDLKKEDVERVKDPENWILQRKVKYADAIQTPDIPAKAEIRLFYFRDKFGSRYIPANNLARLSKGKMIGVRYNKDKEWVGGSFCYFEG